MSNSLPQSVIVRHERETTVAPFHLLILLSLSLGAIAWGEALIFGGGGLQSQSYLALLGFYGAASTAFVMSRIRSGKLNLFEIPVFLTCMFFLQFGLVPLRNFIDPTQIDRHLSGDGEELVRALSYCILGMMGFWAGCEVARRKQSGRMLRDPGRQSILPESREGRVMLPLVALYGVAFCTKFFLLRSHMFSYTGSGEKYWENVGAMQVVNYIAQFGTLALIGIAIERYRRGQDAIWRNLFLVIFSLEVLWGLISGMKGFVFQNFMVVALVSSLVKRRLNVLWLVAPFLALVFLYPVSNAYRAVLGRGEAQVTSFEGAARAGQMAGSRAWERTPTAGGTMREGTNSMLHRMDLLTSVAMVLTLGPRASFVKGNVQWWMLPIYPFVPRLIWPSKPTIVEAGRFTVALGGGSGNATTMNISSTAITYPGDLYLQFGLLGVPIGMFALGLVAQWLTNGMSGPLQRRDLFVYGGVFLFGFPMEADVFSVWGSLMKLLVILYFLSWAIYGPRSRFSGTSRSAQRE